MKPQPSVIRCLPAAALAALCLLGVTCSVGVAADALSGRQLRKNANGVLSILGLSVVPNETVLQGRSLQLIGRLRPQLERHGSSTTSLAFAPLARH